jgi:thiamine biosynthesis lipoprotein
MSALTLEVPRTIEHRATFSCFGGECTVMVADVRGALAREAVERARRDLLRWHRQFSRFESDSELSALNADPAETVAVTPLMRRIVETGIRGARATGGLVDPTLGDAIEDAGYTSHLAGPEIPLAQALELAPALARGWPSPRASWERVSVDRRAGTITRPPGVKLDLGGIAKGVFADELSSRLTPHAAFAVDCAGDIRLGGTHMTARDVHVASPFDDSVLHTFELSSGAIATSGIGRRSWLGKGGTPAHHLLDPLTGRPAFTGVVQVTALAPAAAGAEVLAKAALLSGPDAAERWLPGGGVIVLDDGSHHVVEP